MAYVCLGDMEPHEFYQKFETEKPRHGVKIKTGEKFKKPKPGEKNYRHL